MRARRTILSGTPDYCRSALARYTPRDFLALVERHGIRWHEKKLGQLFCDESALQIIAMLKAECERGGVTWWHAVRRSSGVARDGDALRRGDAARHGDARDRW